MTKVKTIVLSAMLTVGLAATAHALPLALTVTDGVTEKTVVDNGEGDLNPELGAISFTNLALSTYSVTMNSATGLGHPTQAWPEALHLDGVEIKSTTGTNGGSLTFKLVDSSLSLPGLMPYSPNTRADYSVSVSAPTGLGISNTVLYNDTAIGTLTGTAANGGLLSGGTSYLNVDNNFSLSEIVTLDFGSTTGTTSFNARVDLVPTPEPGTLLFMGAGCFGLAVYGKRRRNA